HAAPPPALQPPAHDGGIAELEAALGDKTRLCDKYHANWKEAEAKSDELWRKIGDMQKDLVATREQAVENARAQRQAAQIALTRAVEEAGKKMVSTQDLLTRTERERGELERQVNELRARVAEISAAHDDAEARASAADEETAAARALAAAEITRLREELSDLRNRLSTHASPPTPAHADLPDDARRALVIIQKELEDELRKEELRIAEIERVLREIVQTTAYS